MLLPIEFPEALPVSARRDEIAAAIRAHPVVIVCGETGSGKTTQLPKIALALGRGRAHGGGLIGHTQPRRIAASSVAKRIADELKTPLGEVVGYKVRFQDRLTPDASVKWAACRNVRATRGTISLCSRPRPASSASSSAANAGFG